MSVIFDITTPNLAFEFLTEVVGFRPSELVCEYLVECSRDAELFVERNVHRLDDADINDVHFIAFHVTGSLDDCKEIRESGLWNLQYVLSHDTMFSRQLRQFGIQFNIEKRTVLIDGLEYNVDYDYYKSAKILNQTEELLEEIAHRLYFDYCVDGFFANDRIEHYGTQIHKRPEFLMKLSNLSCEANKLNSYWIANSTPYKIFFFATVEQIHKSTFALSQNNDPYTDLEKHAIKKWILFNAIDQAFDPYGERYIYIKDDIHIPPEQIIRCERMQ